MILAGDIGGTKVNLALFDDATRKSITRYESRDFSSIEEILETFLLKDNDSKIDRACFGVAGQVNNGKCNLTNLSWQIEVERLKELVGTDAVWLINDLAATACSIPYLAPECFEVIQAGVAEDDGRVSVISAGTGLGQAFLIPQGTRKFIVMDSEGGHCDFSPRTQTETELLVFLQKKYSRISIERVLSGPGLLDMYDYFHSNASAEEKENDLGLIKFPASIVERAIAKTSPICERVLKLFVSLYGALAGNIALQYLSKGGVYLGGGIAPKIVPLLREGDFMKSFLSKGRFEEYLAQIPVKVVMDEAAPLLGAVQFALGNRFVN